MPNQSTRWVPSVFRKIRRVYPVLYPGLDFRGKTTHFDPSFGSGPIYLTHKLQAPHSHIQSFHYYWTFLPIQDYLFSAASKHSFLLFCHHFSIILIFFVQKQDNFSNSKTNLMSWKDSVTTGWLRGTVVERWSLTGKLSLSCARPAADGWPLTWANRPL